MKSMHCWTAGATCALVVQACQRWPALKVLYTSGYRHGALDPATDGAAEVRHLLGNPYRRRDLATKVRDALGERAAAA